MGARSHPLDVSALALQLDLLDGGLTPPARQLWAAGIDPVELHRLDLTVRGLRARSESVGATRSTLLAVLNPVRPGRVGGGEPATTPAPALAQVAGSSGEKVS